MYKCAFNGLVTRVIDICLNGRMNPRHNISICMQKSLTCPTPMSNVLIEEMNSLKMSQRKCICITKSYSALYPDFFMWSKWLQTI